MINTAPAVIFPHLVNMKKADNWMPWKEQDPKMIITYIGAEEGVGAISSWESPGDMGTGTAEIVEVIENQSVKTKLTYNKPMKMSQDAEFILTPYGETTKMTWTVRGNHPFVARLMCTLMFINMDKYVGSMFEQGLNKLKIIVENE